MLDDGTFELEGLVGEVDGSVIIPPQGGGPRR